MNAIVVIFLAASITVEDTSASNPPSAPLEAAIPYLVEALKDENVVIRERAARTLAALGPYAKAAVPVLIEALKDDAVAWLAIDALGEIGPGAQAAVPELVSLLGKRHITIPAHAALVKIGPSKTAVELLVKAMTEGIEQTQCNAASVLGEFGDAAKDAIPTLVHALEASGRVADASMYALGHVGRSAVPALVDILEDSEKGEARWRAAFALTIIGPDAADAIPALDSASKEEDDTLQRMAGQALARIRQPKSPGQ